MEGETVGLAEEWGMGLLRGKGLLRSRFDLGKGWQPRRQCCEFFNEGTGTSLL